MENPGFAKPPPPNEPQPVKRLCDAFRVCAKKAVCACRLAVGKEVGATPNPPGAPKRAGPCIWGDGKKLMLFKRFTFSLILQIQYQSCGVFFRDQIVKVVKNMLKLDLISRECGNKLSLETETGSLGELELVGVPAS